MRGVFSLLWCCYHGNRAEVAIAKGKQEVEHDWEDVIVEDERDGSISSHHHIAQEEEWYKAHSECGQQ